MQVLIIDDNTDDIQLMQRYLEQIAPDAKGCTDIQEALTAALATNYDCIIVDHMMPHGNGIDTIKMLRDQDTQTPILLVTGCHDRLIATRCIQEGAQNYFPKEFIAQEPELFRDCVSNTANKQMLETQSRIALLAAQMRAIETRLAATPKFPNIHASASQEHSVQIRQQHLPT